MAEYTIEEIAAAPCFDLELLLSTSQETRIGGGMMESLALAWDRWTPHVKARRIRLEKGGYLAAWLGEAVEEEVDERWEQAPSEAFLYNALAQVMCMGVVHSLLPEVEEAGCAPAPKPDALLARALADIGLPYAVEGEPGLARRFAVLTPYPFKGGCEICAMRSACPKAAGAGEGYSVTLPGFEKDTA